MAGENRIYYRGQGKLFVHKRLFDPVTGFSKPGAGVWLGNAPDFTLTLTGEYQDHRESYSGQNLLDISYIPAKSAAMTATLEEFNAFNLALCLNGESQTVPADAVGKTVEFPDALSAGETYALGDINIDTFSFSDSASQPVAPELYAFDKGTGTLDILGVVAAGAELEYTTLAFEATSMFTQPDAEWWLRYAGVNMLDSNKPTVVDLYRVKFDPAQNLPFISQELAQFPLAGTPLADSNRPANDVFGQFGKIQVVKTAA
jgi:hypothetical protein